MPTPPPDARGPDLDALLTDLIALQKRWRRNHEQERDPDYQGLWETCADELAAVIQITAT